MDKNGQVMVNMGGKGGILDLCPHFGGTVLLGAAGGAPPKWGQIGKYANKIYN